VIHKTKQQLERWYRKTRWVDTELDLDRVMQHQSENQAVQATPNSSEAKLLACVTFHYAEHRLGYVRQVLELLGQAPFACVQRVVQTNTPKTQEVLGQEFPDVVFDLHDSLEDPFMLAWCHRSYLPEQVESFDVFAYVEDDIAISPAGFARWQNDEATLREHGYLFGFLRVELDYRGQWVCSDMPRPATRDDIIEIDGKPYLASPFPYHACWIYSQATMKQFVESPFYRYETFEADPRFAKMGIRERAANGLMYENIPADRRSATLIPINEQGEIAREAMVYHLPSNYGRAPLSHAAGLGKLPIDQAIEG